MRVMTERTCWDGHYADDDVRLGDGVTKIVRDVDVDREDIAGKVGEILSSFRAAALPQKKNETTDRDGARCVAPAR